MASQVRLNFSQLQQRVSTQDEIQPGSRLLSPPFFFLLYFLSYFLALRCFELNVSALSPDPSNVATIDFGRLCLRLVWLDCPLSHYPECQSASRKPE